MSRNRRFKPFGGPCPACTAANVLISTLPNGKIPLRRARRRRGRVMRRTCNFPANVHRARFYALRVTGRSTSRFSSLRLAETGLGESRRNEESGTFVGNDCFYTPMFRYPADTFVSLDVSKLSIVFFSQSHHRVTKIL